jgi:hypothetical protein
VRNIQIFIGFLIGIGFIIVGLPLLDGLSQIISDWFESLKSRIGVNTMKNNYKIYRIREKMNESGYRVVGGEPALYYNDDFNDEDYGDDFEE